MKKKELQKNLIPANPENWSEKSKQSVAYDFGFRKEYGDIHYQCRRCKKPSIFTAEQQKYTYEVKKAYIDQRRILCTECWKESNEIAGRIRSCEELWADSKEALKNNFEFLSEWLNLLARHEEYVPYKPNTAIKNMLEKLLNLRSHTDI